MVLVYHISSDTDRGLPIPIVALVSALQPVRVLVPRPVGFLEAGNVFSGDSLSYTIRH